MVPVWVGQRYGLHVKKRIDEVQDAPISSAVAAALGLLAFMLAFTFQIVGNRLDNRKQLLLNEISDIRTAYQCAGLVPEPIRSQTRKLVLRYIDIRVDFAYDRRNLTDVAKESTQILDSLWRFSEELAALDRSSEAFSLYMSSISNMVSLYHQRFTVTFQTGLPPTIVYVLIFVAFFSMLTLGYQFGISGKGSFPVNLLMGIAFASVIWLIFALDHPETGIIKLSRAPLLSLQQELHKR